MQRTSRPTLLLSICSLCATLVACGNSAPAAQPSSSTQQPMAAIPASESGSAKAGSGAAPASTSVATNAPTPVTAQPASAGAGGQAARSGVSGASASGTPASGTPAAGTLAAAGGGSGGGTAAAAGSSAGAGPAAGSSPASGGGRFPDADPGADGPYKAVTVADSGPNKKYTVYHPETLAPDGLKHPLIGWMSGGSTTPDLYPMLPRLATHGFIVVASNTAPGIGEEVALGKEIIAGIDWMLAENDRADSKFAGKVDVKKVAAMGYSMGALATTTIAGDPRLTTTVHISGGNMETSRIDALHAPAAFLCGASGVDIAGENCATDFAAAKTPVFYGVFKEGDHLGILLDPYSARISKVATGWLRWQLMQDASLKTMFVGQQCAVCTDANWIVQQKGLE